MLSACALIFLSAGSASAVSDLLENNPSFAAIEAAWREWKTSVEFKCTFTYRAGSAPTKALALDGQFGATVGNPKAENYARGVFYKLGDRWRYSQEYIVHPLREGSEATGEDAHLFFDEISTSTLTLGSEKKGGRLSAVVIPRPDNLAGISVSGPWMANVFHPFSAGLKLDGTLREFLGARPGMNEKIVEASIAKPHSDRIQIHVIKTFRTDTDTITIRIVFRTDAVPPVIERIEFLLDVPSRSLEQQCVVMFKDVVQCKGGLMPRCVRKVFGPIVPVGKDRPVWTVDEWKSDDIGVDDPIESDFIYVAPLSSSIVGLNAEVPIVNGEYNLDLASYTPADFLFTHGGNTVAMPQKGPPSEPAPALHWRLLLFGNGIFVLVILFLLAWRYRRW